MLEWLTVQLEDGRHVKLPSSDLLYESQIEHSRELGRQALLNLPETKYDPDHIDYLISLIDQACPRKILFWTQFLCGLPPRRHNGEDLANGGCNCHGPLERLCCNTVKAYYGTWDICHLVRIWWKQHTLLYTHESCLSSPKNWRMPILSSPYSNWNQVESQNIKCLAKAMFNLATKLVIIDLGTLDRKEHRNNTSFFDMI